MEEDKRLWNHTASLMALHANLNRDPKRTPQPYKPETFIPYTQERKKAKFVHELSDEEKDLTMKWAKNFKNGRERNK